MGGKDGVVTVDAGTRVSQALELMAKGGFEQLPVVEGGRLIGMLTLADVAGQIQLREALRLSEE